MDIKKEILKTIEYIVDSKLRRASFDKTYNGIIKVINGDGTYNVMIDNKTYTNIKSTVPIIQVNDIVKVTAPQNQFSQIYISATFNF
jgi:hypothetical protein